MKKAVFLALAVVLLGGIGWWFWSLGNLPRMEDQMMRLIPTRGVVELERQGQSNWESVTKETGVHAGDVVRTGENSSATVSYYGTGETRLDANTQLSLVDAPDTANAQSSVQMRVELLAGRAWTRLQRLLDVKSSFEMKANAVTATVRGTAFAVDVRSHGTVVSVTDADVQVQAQRPMLINEGSEASFDANGGSTATSTISTEEAQSDWFAQNTASDVAFVQHAQDAIRARLSALGGVAPDSALYGVQQLSERMHLAAASSKAPDLYAQYTERRLFQVVGLVQAGKTGRAFQEMSLLTTDIDSHLQGKDADAYRAALMRDTRDITRVLEMVDPSSALYPLKQRVEDLQNDIAGRSALSAEYTYARLMTIESSLIAASALLDQRTTNSVSDLLDAARLGLDNVTRDLDGVVASADDLAVLRGKAAALSAREAGLRERLHAGFPEVNGETTPLPEGATTSTSSTVALPDVSATSTTSTIATLQSITVRTTPNPVLVGAVSNLLVVGSMSDGTTMDLTTRSQFTILGTFGAVNGPTFTAQSAGTGTVQANVMYQGVRYTAQTSIRVVAPAVTLVRLDVIPMGQTTLPPGGSLPMRLTATYSDGSTKDVTSSATYSVSDARLGLVEKSTFFATTNQIVGSLRITAHYTEGSTTMSGILDVSIR